MNTKSPTSPKTMPPFDRRMYGALLRHQRMEAGYRKGEEFVADLAAIGLDIPVATLYRYERGDQEPTFAFIAAANLLLFGNPYARTTTEPCIPEEWTNPKSSDAVMRVLRANGALNRRPLHDSSAVERAAYYDKVMSAINSYDFDVFPNGSCTDTELYMTVRYGEYDEMFPEDANMESYRIQYPEDIERAILNFIKSRNFKMAGTEIDKLVQYGNRAMKSELEAYGLI